jgi:hypothetical protein
MFALRMILEKCYEFNINVHQLYIDFKQAYDSINRKKLYDVLREMQIPAKLIRLVKITLKNTKAKNPSSRTAFKRSLYWKRFG